MSKFIQINNDDGNNLILNIDCIKSIKNLFQDTDAGEEEAEKKNRLNGYGKNGIIYCYEPDNVIVETTDDEVLRIRYDTDEANALRAAIKSKYTSGFFDGQTGSSDFTYKFISVSALSNYETYTDDDGNVKRHKRLFAIRIDSIDCFYYDIDPLTHKKILRIEILNGRSIMLDAEDNIETTKIRGRVRNERIPSDAKNFLAAIDGCNKAYIKDGGGYFDTL